MEGHGRFSYTLLVWMSIFFAGAASVMSRSKRGPMRQRQATTFDNCRNQLGDVLQSILGL